MLQKLSSYFDRHGTLGLFAGYLFIAVIGFLDYKTGYRLGFSIFYLIPIALVVWHAGLRAGITIAAAGTIIWILADITAREENAVLFIVLWNAAIRMGFFVTAVFVLANLRLSLEREKMLARTDALTGIANNQAFAESLNDELQRSQRYHRPLTLAYLDCDHFKTVNDSFGHETGNRLLKKVAETIKNSARVTDRVGRLGGDEFLMLFPETDSEESKNIIMRTQKNLLDTMKKNDWPVTFSIGVATFTKPLGVPSNMISETDRLMYQAKKKGKNCIVYQTFS